MFTLPSLPVSHRKLPGWIQSKPKVSVHEIVQPYNEYDAVVRKLFAQEPSHSLLEDTHLNVVPLYNEHDKADIRVRARQVESESPQTKEKYIIPLKDGDRRPTGSPAVVPSLQEFSKNFTIFSEGALSDLDWSNVVVAGSAVVTCLLPVPEQYNDSKRSLRKFYHEKIAPASDVDLFLYGLDEQQALDKIRQIEERIKNTILYETTTIRAKNAITIVSQYPTRHIQIVLRIYKSVAEILTGFDVDCSCAAFDGRQVYVSPRALASYITQINTIDLTRRSPSYENRLSKYSHRGFEIFWPDLDRSQVDPTIFERSFTRVVGLARLLVLERLPKQSDRDSYIEQRREERGRPAPKGDTWWKNKQHGDLKSDWEDEVPEWEADEVVSSYETFRIPYGPRYNARRIERLIYAKDLLLNAEWNKKKERQVNLHRHPAFFGNVDDVIQDCCGFCPKPVTPEDFEVAGKESKIYVSGEVSFIKDDPGRQEIGSFNPTTETEWTDMAYFGHTEVLCQAIVDCDLDKVQEYVSTDAMSINSRDCTGRTPLHLACMTSTSSIVQCLVDHGARLVSRLADGRTALHLAAARGSVDMVRILLRKSEQNEEAWGARKTQIDEGNDLGSAEESKSCTSGSFVKVDESPDREINDPLSVEDAEDEPDIYDINAVSWDNHTSALHLAILNGHAEVAHELVSSFGADVLLPVKLVHDYNNSPRAAILTLVLVLNLEPNQAARMTKTLLQLGASPTQADMDNATPLTYMASSRHNNLLDVFLIYSGPATRKAINYFTCKCCSWYPQIYSPLLASINFRNLEYANMLLQAGANPSILFEQFVKPGQGVYEQIRDGTNHRLNEIFRHGLTQPVMLAVQQQLPLLALSLLELGADANTLTPASYKAQDEDRRLAIYESGMSLLDCVKDNLKELRAHLGDKSPNELQRTYSFMEDYLSDLVEDTYQWWATRNVVWNAKRQNCSRSRRAKPDETSQQKGQAEKDLAVQALICDYEKLEEALTARGAKPLRELYPKLLANEEDATEPAKPKLFKARLTFTNIRDMTAKKHKAYIDLFQAAWAGDLETVKYLTLTIGDAEHDHLPLQIAVLDQHGFSPFSIAALRGHRQLAKIVLEIAQAQYKLEEPDVHEVYDLDMEDEDMSSDEDSDNIRFRKDVVDNRFTIEDIGEVAGQVRSEISAYDMFLWNFQGSKFLAAQNIRDAEALDNGSGLSQDTSECPNGLVEYAIWVNDVELLRFLLKLGQEFVQVKTSGDAKIYRVTNGVTQFAMRKGHTDCLEELLRNTGADLPIDIMLQSCGIDIKKKPKYYQGLSIHGKKRADWAAAGRGNETSPRTSNHPLLLAAFQGNLKSVEWYLSSAPERLYSEFITEHEQEPRLKLLAQQGDRMTAALTKWLSSKNHLLLHCAVLSYTTEDSTSLVKYLVQRAPQYLETKSAGGYTPLALAFALHRTEFAQILIDAGADQTTRDKKGNNLIHLALCDAQVRPRLVDDNIEQLLKLLDARLASSLLTERSSDHPGSLTPFARWLHSCGSRRHYARPNYGRKVPDILATARCVLNFARPINQKFLEMFDGAGNTPLHEAVRFQYPGLFKLLLEYRPDLLFRENAVGSTPLELATDSWVTHVTSRCPPIHPSDPSQSGIQDPETKWVFNRSPETFAPGYRAPEHPKITIYKIAREQADSNPRKRRLVSLNEATEVTKRLALRSERKAKDESEDDGEDVGDEVTRYYGMRV